MNITKSDLRRWSRKLHLYAGLLTCSSLLLLGSSGLTAFVHHTRGDSGVRRETTRLAPFEAPEGMSDVDVANLVRSKLALPMTLPLTEDAVRHDADGHLAFIFYNVNGSYVITVLEESKQLRIVERRLGLAGFLVRAHSTLLRPSQPGLDWRILLLSVYMATTLALLSVLLPTGLCIWLWTRPRHRLARLGLAAALGLFAALWVTV